MFLLPTFWLAWNIQHIISYWHKTAFGAIFTAFHCFKRILWMMKHAIMSRHTLWADQKLHTLCSRVEDDMRKKAKQIQEQIWEEKVTHNTDLAQYESPPVLSNLLSLSPSSLRFRFRAKIRKRRCRKKGGSQPQKRTRNLQDHQWFGPQCTPHRW